MWQNKICCENHPNSFVIEDFTAGDLICSACGLVLSERCIDLSNEWRNFSEDLYNKNDKSRVGEPEWYGGNNNLHTITSTRTTNTHQSLHSRFNTEPPGEKKTKKLFHLIDQYCNTISNDAVSAQAKSILAKICNQEEKWLFKKNNKLVCFLIIYISFIKSNLIPPMNELYHILQIKPKAKCLKNHLLKLNSFLDRGVEIKEPKSLISHRVDTILGEDSSEILNEDRVDINDIDECVLNLFSKILSNINKSSDKEVMKTIKINFKNLQNCYSVSSLNTRSLIATSVYLSLCQLNRVQQDEKDKILSVISSCCEITEKTLKGTIKKLIY